MERRRLGTLGEQTNGAHAHGNDDALHPDNAAMTWQTALLMLLVALWAVTQYGLAAHAIMDLRRRPTVRGNNKVIWTLVILGVPIVGALAYAVYGPTSFIRRDRPITTVPTVPVSATRPTSDRPTPAADRAVGQPPTADDVRVRSRRSARATVTERPGTDEQPEASARQPRGLPSISDLDDGDHRLDGNRGVPGAAQQQVPGDRGQRRSSRSS